MVTITNEPDEVLEQIDEDERQAALEEFRERDAAELAE
jgi:hypothetical protein